ncbi:chloramphenicol phosphotransferase CPT family protein [Andreprevotia chitinilytica]|uniref:chloramphenicol phosphotransferase CPT family protein n=1 Tax=Andreprevotia chitinilytica TaxID=396808 RepID=UPI00055268BD|nr:AAA family ATPase [Andreprevotia chitinilytica]
MSVQLPTLPQVIVLNGTSSSGKTSIAKALQERLPEQYLNFSIDSILDALPASDLGKMQRGEIITRAGYDWPALVRGYHYAMPSLLQAGLKLIVDNAWCERDEQRELLTELAGYSVALVAVQCELATAVARETQRGDRAAGLATWEFERVHQGIVYDFAAVTDQSSPGESAGQIMDWLMGAPLLRGASETLEVLNLGD